MKFFTLRSYLFSVITLLLCINIAQALNQIVTCVVPNAGNKNYYEVTFITYDGIGYSSFGKATSFGNVGSFNMSFQDKNDRWEISQNPPSATCCGKSKDTWSIMGSYPQELIVINSDKAICSVKGFTTKEETELATKVIKFYDTEKAQGQDRDNPIRMTEINCQGKKINEATALLIEDSESKRTCTLL